MAPSARLPPACFSRSLTNGSLIAFTYTKQSRTARQGRNQPSTCSRYVHLRKREESWVGGQSREGLGRRAPAAILLLPPQKMVLSPHPVDKLAVRSSCHSRLSFGKRHGGQQPGEQLWAFCALPEEAFIPLTELQRRHAEAVIDPRGGKFLCVHARRLEHRLHLMPIGKLDGGGIDLRRVEKDGLV